MQRLRKATLRPLLFALSSFQIYARRNKVEVAKVNKIAPQPTKTKCAEVKEVGLLPENNPDATQLGANYWFQLKQMEGLLHIDLSLIHI